MTTTEVSSGGTVNGKYKLTDQTKKKNEVSNTVEREDKKQRNEVPTNVEIKQTKKRKFNTEEDKNIKNKENDISDMEVSEDGVKEGITKVKETTTDKEELEEHARKIFFEALNNKKKVENYDQEVYKTSNFVIHYYDWDDIPDLCNLPYDLINKENDELFKNHRMNYLMFLMNRDKTKHDEKEVKEKEKQKEKEGEKEKGEEKEMEEQEDKVKGEQKNEENEEEEKEEKGKEEKEKEEVEEEAEEGKKEKAGDSETDETDETGENEKKEKDAEECVYKKHMSTLLYEDIKKYFSKKSRKDVEVSTLKKAKSFAVEETERGVMETHLEQKEEVADVKTKREPGTEIQTVEKEESDWTMDFVALTNIQILGKHSNQLNEWNTIEILLPQIIEYCCSPRSSVCKNSFLAIKHLCMSWKNKKVLLNNLFVHIFPFIIKKLDVKNNFLKNCVMTAVEEFMLYGNTVNNFEMLRLICNHSNDKNAIITKHMAYYVYSFLKNLPKNKLKQIPLTELATPFVNFLHAKLEVTRKYMKQVFSLLLKVKTEEEIIECFKNGIPRKQNFKTIEMSIRNILDQNINGNGPPLKRSYSSFLEFRTMQKMGSVHHFSSN